MREATKDEGPSLPAALYPRLMGTYWNDLDSAVRQAHLDDRRSRRVGSFQVRHGHSKLAQLLVWTMDFPPPAEAIAIELVITPLECGERWARRFGDKTLDTTQTEGTAGVLIERASMVELWFRLEAKDGVLIYVQIGAALRFGLVSVPLPKWLWPRVEAREGADGSNRTHVFVSLTAPLAGFLISYEGHIHKGGAGMTATLWLLAIQGVIGAFDTVYYHEWRARLPALVPSALPELRLHAARDFLYAVLFGTLPWVAWRGLWLPVFVSILVAEAVLTLADFVVEIVVRKPIGDVYAGERITHAVMGILYGGLLVNLIPVLLKWWSLPTGIAFAPPAIPEALRWGLLMMAAGVFLSGIRDLYAATQLPGGNWPWAVLEPSDAGTHHDKNEEAPVRMSLRGRPSFTDL